MAMQSFFDSYQAHETIYTGTQLVLAMLGMGATQRVGEFRAILKRPAKIGWVLVLQFLLMPMVAIAFAQLLRLPGEIAIGLLLMMALPSGSQSNVIAYLGRGNLPLSITATCASTTVCLVLTPLVLHFGAMPLLTTPSAISHTAIPIDHTLANIALLLILPLLVGMAIGYRWPSYRHRFAQVAITGSFVALLLVVVGALGGGRLDLLRYGWWVPLSLILLIVATLLAIYYGTLLFHRNTKDAYTIAIEVALRNGNLGIALCVPLFGATATGGDASNALYNGSMYVCLFGGGVMLVVGLLAALRRQLRFLPWRVPSPTATNLPPCATGSAGVK